MSDKERQELKRRMSEVIDIAIFVDDNLIQLQTHVAQLKSCILNRTKLDSANIKSIRNLIYWMLLQYSALVSGNMFSCVPAKVLNDKFIYFDEKDQDILNARVKKKDKFPGAVFLSKWCIESCIALQNKIGKLKQKYRIRDEIQV